MSGLALIEVIENTPVARAEFIKQASKTTGGGCAVSHLKLTRVQLENLQKGKCVAIDDGEYTTFITLE